MKILVIDKDAAWLREAQAAVEAGGHAIEHMADLPPVGYTVQAFIEAVLISWESVPNAAWWVRQLRHSAPGIEVLALIELGQQPTMCEAFESGVVDCLVKPVRPAEAIARLELMAWRKARHEQTIFQVGDVHVDLDDRRVARAGLPVPLTATEWNLLAIVLSRRGRVVTRAELEATLPGDGIDPSSNRIEVHISNLRRKLGPGFIKTERRMGYRFGD